MTTLFSLKPKWCISVNTNGNHKVCVCSYHQSMKLLLNVFEQRIDYKSLIEESVCNINNYEDDDNVTFK